MSDVITVHKNEQHLRGMEGDSWYVPPSTVDHAYRGAGRSRPGEPGFDWEPCMVCQKAQDDPVHGRPFRSCSYCGSIHPEDLFRIFETIEVRWFNPETFTQGVAGQAHQRPTIEWADMKYGWPHKLYVSPDDGKMGHHKFYSVHLRDFPELIDKFNSLFEGGRVQFNIGTGEHEGQLGYRIG